MFGGETDPAKICKSQGKKQLCAEVVCPDTNKRYHVELDADGVINAWVPTGKCWKVDNQPDGFGYAALNRKSNRFHYLSGKLKGKFAKGTFGSPRGLVTGNRAAERSRWQTQNGSPRASPFQSNVVDSLDLQIHPEENTICSSKGSSSGLKALDLVTTVLSKDTMEASDALCFTYHKRTASYKAGFFGGTGSEHVQFPFIQFRREGSASLNKEGRIELGQDAVLTEVSLSDVTRGSIRGTANYLYAKNNHNLDAGLGEILDGFREIGKGIVADELAHGFCDAMSRRGYPAKSVERAYQLVAKPLYRAWKQKGFQGVMDYQNTSDILRELKDHAISDPVAFVTDAVNTAAPLLGSDLPVQWDENYKGFNILGYGAGWGTQVDTGTERTVRDTGLHASRRFRSTLNTVGASGCLGKSVETVSRRFADDTGHLASTTETRGARAKADILGVNIAEVRAGYVRAEGYRVTIQNSCC